jgi:hypothetical protein
MCLQAHKFVAHDDGSADVLSCALRRNAVSPNCLIEAGPFEVRVARTFRLDHALDAHRALDAHYLGKLALKLV